MPDEQGNMVESLSQFIERLKSIHPSKDEIVVYRGHSDAEDYELKPGLFRKGKEKLRINEDNIVRDIEAARPMDFINERTTLDKLVKMQHYGLPTRLLDVTSSPLTALYFAVTPYEKEENGAVLALKIPKKLSKFFDSDTVACLANLVYLTRQEKDYLFTLANDYRSFKRMPIEDFRRNTYLNEENYSRFQFFIEQTKNREGMSCGEASYLEHEWDPLPDFLTTEKERQLAEINAKDVVVRLLHFIRADKPYFCPKICPTDLLRVLHVKTKQHNARIVAQNGAFLIFGLEDKSSQEIPGISIEKIVIHGKKKKEIAQNLSSLGISESSLFPELECYTKHVVDVYKKS
nr:FRG domain-containing protein [uncultured Fretibacterium sp.]